MHLLSATLVALMLLTVPPAATAQAPSTNAPPGNSAIDEYLETVPGATGNQRPRPSSDGAAPGPAALTRAQRERLERAGPDGEALANLVDTTSPASKSSPQKDDAPVAAGPGRSPVREVVGAATGQGGGGGMGFVLPAILLASLIGAIAVVVMRRRAST